MSSILLSVFRYCLLAPLLAVLLVSACARATTENYVKVNAGMSHAQVYNLLGKPDEVVGGGIGPFSMSSETWKGHRQTIHVTFGGDVVALKAIVPTGSAAE